jgi:heme exporter protein D
MMPELGKYAGYVLGSYAASIALIVALVAVSLWQSKRIKLQLDEAEKRRGASDE